MTGPYCPREPEILRAAGRAWREATDADAAAHASTCPRCADVRAAAELLLADLARETQSARVPSGAAMWWRLERRLRHERARRMQRIALGLQAMVLACAAGVALAVLQIAAPWLDYSGAALQRWSGMISALAAFSNAVATWTLPVAMLTAAWLVLLPAAVYLWLVEE